MNSEKEILDFIANILAGPDAEMVVMLTQERFQLSLKDAILMVAKVRS